MARFEIADHTGHSVWPPKGMFRPEAEFSVANLEERIAARVEHDRLVAEGYAVAHGDPPVLDRTKTFNPDAERTLYLLPLHGG